MRPRPTAVGGGRRDEPAGPAARRRDRRHGLPVPRRRRPVRLLGEHPRRPRRDRRRPGRPLGPGRLLRPRLRRPTTGSPAGAAATSTRRSRSTRPRTGSCPAPSTGASPSSSSSSTPPAPPWPTPGCAGGVPDGRRVEVVIGRGNYFNRGNLTRLQHGRIVAQTLAILRVAPPRMDRGRPRGRPRRPEGEPPAVRAGDDPRPAHQRHGRPGRQPARPGRGELRRRRRQRLVAGRARPRRAGAGRAAGRPGAGRRGLPRGRRRLPDGLLPARRPVAVGPSRGRSPTDADGMLLGRRGGRGRPQAAGATPSATATGSTPCQGGRARQRRPGAGPGRAERPGPRPGDPPGLSAVGRRPGDRRPGRGARAGRPGGRPRRAAGARGRSSRRRPRAGGSWGRSRR